MRTFACGLLILGLILPPLSGCDSGGGVTTRAGGGRTLRSLGRVKEADGQVVRFSIVNSDITDRELAALAEFPQLQSVWLQECDQLTDDGLSALSESAELTSLKLIWVPITDDALRHFQNARRLADVELSNTRITGAGLEHLAGGSVARLVIHSRQVTSEGLAAVTHLKSLRTLELHCPEIKIADLPSFEPLGELEALVALRTPLGEGGLERLRGHAGLRTLVLDATSVDDAALPVLNTLSGIEELHLNGSQVTNEGLKQLQLPSLKILSLDGCVNVTDAGLKNLAGLTSLESLNLTESSVTGEDLTGLGVIKTLKNVEMSGEQFRGNDASIEALKQILPECEVQILRG